MHAPAMAVWSQCSSPSDASAFSCLCTEASLARARGGLGNEDNGGSSGLGQPTSGPRALCAPRHKAPEADRLDIVSVVHALSEDRNCQDDMERVGRQLALVSQTNMRNQHLLLAVEADDAPGVLQHIADGADLPLMGEALRVAAHSGSINTVKELVAIGLSVNEGCPKTNFTPLQLACASGQHCIAELLLEALADVHQEINGISPFAMAKRSGHVDVEQVLTKHITSLLVSESARDESSRRAFMVPRVSEEVSQSFANMPEYIAGSIHGYHTTEKHAEKVAAAKAQPRFYQNQLLHF